MATPLYGNAFLQLPEVEWGLDDEKFTRFTYIVRTVKHTVMPKKELPCFEVATTDFVQKSNNINFFASISGRQRHGKLRPFEVRRIRL